MPSQAETFVGEFLVLFAVKKYMTDIPRRKMDNLCYLDNKES